MKQLTPEERYHIRAMFCTGESARAIARALRVTSSTITREIGRNGAPDAFRRRAEAAQGAAALADRQTEKAGKSAKKAAADKRVAVAAAVREAAASLYDPVSADERRLERRRHIGGRHIRVSIELADVVFDEIEELLRRRYSPEQICKELEKLLGHAPFSHTWLYEHIAWDRENGGKLHLYLRRRGKQKKGEEGDGRGQIPDRTSIDERPAAADNREETGHWEIDTIIGAHHRGALLTAVDRCSRMLLIRLMPDRTAASVLAVCAEMFGGHPVHTVTADNGKEFAGHKKIAALLAADFFFAKPYQSCQRGSNENANGLVRDFFPKGTDFTRLDPQEVRDAAEHINQRPMRLHDWRSRAEVHRKDAAKQQARTGAQAPAGAQPVAA